MSRDELKELNRRIRQDRANRRRKARRAVFAKLDEEARKQRDFEAAIDPIRLFIPE